MQQCSVHRSSHRVCVCCRFTMLDDHHARLAARRALGSIASTRERRALNSWAGVALGSASWDRRARAGVEAPAPPAHAHDAHIPVPSVRRAPH